jgi:uncharacterized Zn-binding protein involved in type VI secretion
MKKEMINIDNGFGGLRLTDTLLGTAPEHVGHIPPHFVTVTGHVSIASNNVFINRLGASRKSDLTDEFDECCGMSNGHVGTGSGTVFVNGIPAGRKKDWLDQHAGSGIFTSGSNNVFIGD